MHSLITARHIEDYQRDGVVLIKGLFAGYIDLVRDGIEANMRSRPYAAENLKPGGSGGSLMITATGNVSTSSGM